MVIQNRLTAPIIKRKQNGENYQIDLDAFVKHILLFDHYILNSTRLLEIPKLLEAFSFQGFMSLLESGAFSISCFPVMTASLGPTMFVDDPNPIPGKIRPPTNYSLSYVSFAQPLNELNGYIDNIITTLNLNGRQSARLRKGIYSIVIDMEIGTENNISIASTAQEITSTPSLLEKACSISAQKKFGIIIPPEQIRVFPTQLSPFDFEVQSNLQTEFGLNQIDAHSIVESGILALAGRNDRINLMKCFNCLSGFSEEDLPVFGEKLSFLAEALNPKIREGQFTRIIELRNLPSIPPVSEITIDARKLIQIRESSECIQFRHWLANVETMTDQEIQQQGHSLNERIGSLIRSDIGRTIRFVVSNSIGLVSGVLNPLIGQAVSLPISAVDEFLLETIFPKPGPISFVDNLYPSIFEKINP